MDDLVFMYAGQGSQLYHMGRELYEVEPRFRAAMDECDALCAPALGGSLVGAIYDRRRSRHDPFDQTLYSHPALVAIEVALTRVLAGWGLAPRYVLGYSVGEIAAAVVAGVIGLAEGLHLAVAQARLLDAHCRPGGMLAILDRPALVERQPELFAGCAVAAYNFDRHFVVAGPSDRLAALHDRLSREEIPTTLLPVSQAFHSPLMEPARAGFEALGESLCPERPRIALVSATAGGEIPGWQPGFLWEIARRPVRFHQTVQELARRGPLTFVDLGPAGTLANFVKYGLPADAGACAVATLTRSGADAERLAATRAALEQRSAGPRGAGARSHAMDETKLLRMEHSIEVERPPLDAYRLINAVDLWPQIFPPCQEAHVVERNGNRVTIEVTARVGDGVRTWRSRRRLHEQDYRVDFEQVDPFPPLVAMTGYWQVEPAAPAGSRIVLVHEFVTNRGRAAQADPPKTLQEAASWIQQVCDSNSQAELAAFKTACEAGVV